MVANQELSDVLDVPIDFNGGAKRYLVTGGAGFIGFHTCMALLKLGHNVQIVDELNDYYDTTLKQRNLDTLRTIGKPDQLSIEIGDICDSSLMHKVFQSYKPNFVIHLAARAGVRPSLEDPLLYVRSNIVGTTVLLEEARQVKCEKFVYASSSSVYGGSTNEVFSEEDKVDNPVSPYAATKKATELMAHTYYHLYKMPCIGLRFFTVYGPRGRPDMAPFKFMDSIANGRTINQFGDGSSSRDYTYIDDIVDGILRSVSYGKGCKVYNLGNGTPMYLTEFIRTIETVIGKKAMIKICPEQPGDVPRTCADIALARKDLGYNPRTRIRDGIIKTAEWYHEEFRK